MGIVNQIRLNGEAITDQCIVEIVLRSLPKKFKMAVTTILESLNQPTKETFGNIQQNFQIAYDLDNNKLSFR
jgi:hypothetical protein